MWTDLRDFLLLTDAGWWVGTGLIIAGILALAVYAWRNLGDVQGGPLPRKLASPPAAPNWHRSSEPHIRQHWRREDSDTQVIPSIPGATPQAAGMGTGIFDGGSATAGPVCPTCGGPFGNCQCYSQKGSTEAAALAPPYAALSRFFAAVDEAHQETDAAMHGIVEDLAGRDCPLTTQELPPLDAALPMHDATVRASDTRDLTVDIAKILEARNA
jgi:hypothetical protein